ncbi:MAG: HI0074 family nucleotidyltransferase substrate-binding subunit [Patescibacteria group bacterium]
MNQKKQSGFIHKYALYQTALKSFSQGIEDYKTNTSSEIMKAGLIKMYEFTWELAWKTIKEYLEDENIEFMPTPRQVIKEAYQLHLLDEADDWTKLLDDRNLMNHTYDQMRADVLLLKIVNEYHKLFQNLDVKLTQIASEYEQE